MIFEAAFLPKFSVLNSTTVWLYIETFIFVKVRQCWI